MAVAEFAVVHVPSTFAEELTNRNESASGSVEASEFPGLKWDSGHLGLSSLPPGVGNASGEKGCVAGLTQEIDLNSGVTLGVKGKDVLLANA